MPDWSRPDFDWDDGNALHIIAAHDVYPDEAEQVFYNGAYVRRVGKRYRVYGQDNAGRYLFIVCELRGGLVRVITARDMDRDERKLYERHRRT
jgi:uncharacterized DUF497 family protein